MLKRVYSEEASDAMWKVIPINKKTEKREIVANLTVDLNLRFAYLLSGTGVSSVVMCADHPGLTFTLSLIRTQPTYNQPMQQWSFVSDFAVS